MQYATCSTVKKHPCWPTASFFLPWRFSYYCYGSGGKMVGGLDSLCCGNQQSSPLSGRVEQWCLQDLWNGKQGLTTKGPGSEKPAWYPDLFYHCVYNGCDLFLYISLRSPDRNVKFQLCHRIADGVRSIYKVEDNKTRHSTAIQSPARNNRLYHCAHTNSCRDHHCDAARLLYDNDYGHSLCRCEHCILQGFRETHPRNLHSTTTTRTRTSNGRGPARWRWRRHGAHMTRQLTEAPLFVRSQTKRGVHFITSNKLEMHCGA